MTEHQIQVQLFRWWHISASEDKHDLLFAIPNGGARNAITGAMLKSEGVKRGVPDMFLALPIHGKHGLWIELKTEKGRLTSEQVHMCQKLSEQGYAVRTCYGFDEARRAIIDYFTGEMEA